MAHVFRFPDVGEGLAEAEVVEWYVDVGAYVTADAVLVAVETDKAQVEIPSPIAGFLLHQGAVASEIIEVGAVLAVLGSQSEVWPELHSPMPTPLGEGLGEASEAPPLVGTLDESAEVLESASEATAGVASSVVVTPVAVSPARALPLVRKFARDNEVDLGAVMGTGPQGRVTRSDVEAHLAGLIEKVSTEAEDDAPDNGHAVESAPAEPLGNTDVEPRSGLEAQELAADPEPTASDISKSEPTDEDQPTAVQAEHRTVRMSATRRAISANMAKSWSEIPHVTTFGKFDASQLLRSRKALSKRHGMSIPLDAFIVAATLPVLIELPAFNATLSGENLTLHNRVHAGLAINTDRGLMVAVIRDAGQLGLRAIATSILELSEKAKSSSLTTSDLRGATFTVSNIGAAGGGFGTPLIPYGTTAILSVGRAEEEAVVRDGEIAIATMAPLSLSYDHRVIDGVTGRRFLELLIENLEEPTLFLA